MATAERETKWHSSEGLPGGLESREQTHLKHLGLQFPYFLNGCSACPAELTAFSRGQI